MLQLHIPVWVVPAIGKAVVQAQSFLFTAFLRDDQDNAIGAPGAVQCGSRRTLEYIDALPIVCIHRIEEGAIVRSAVVDVAGAGPTDITIGQCLGRSDLATR